MAVFFDHFLHDWVDVVEFDTSYETDIVKSAAGAIEDRRSLIHKPRRKIRFKWKGLSRREANRKYLQLARVGFQDGFIVPLYMDQMQVSALGATGLVVNVETTAYRRLKNEGFDGGLLVANVRDGVLLYEKKAYANGGIAPTSITLNSPLSEIYGARAIALPTLFCEANLDPGEFLFQNDDAGEVGVEFDEFYGSAAMPHSTSDNADAIVLADVAYASSGANANFGVPALPILKVSHEWSAGFSSKVQRMGARYRLGHRDRVLRIGRRSQFEHSIRLLIDDRKIFWQLLNFFDNRRGRARPFYMLSPARMFEPVAIATTHVDVRALGLIQDVQDFVDFVGIQTKGATAPIYVAKVASVVDLGGNTWRISFVAMIPAVAFADLDGVTQAHFCRFSEDVLHEVWETGEVVRIQFKVIDVLDEIVSDFPVVP